MSTSGKQVIQSLVKIQRSVIKFHDLVRFPENFQGAEGISQLQIEVSKLNREVINLAQLSVAADTLKLYILQNQIDLMRDWLISNLEKARIIVQKIQKDLENTASTSL